MARTRRRHSYRRDRRWNPIFKRERYRGRLYSYGDYNGHAIVPMYAGRGKHGYSTSAFPGRFFRSYSGAQSGIRARRNPGHDADFVKHFKNGGRIEVWNDGEVCVFDALDRDQDDFHIKPHEVPRLIQDVRSAPLAAWHHYTKDMVRDDYEMQGRGKRSNPRGRKRGGSRFTRDRRGRRWESAVHGSMPWFANPRRRRGRGRRRNPDVHGNAGKAHPAYDQYLLKLGFGLNDPIVEVGMAWARGEAASSKLISQAIRSAELSMESRDRRVAQNAKNVANKLRHYLKEQNRHEGYREKPRFKDHTLIGGDFRWATDQQMKDWGHAAPYRR